MLALIFKNDCAVRGRRGLLGCSRGETFVLLVIWNHKFSIFSKVTFRCTRELRPPPWGHLQNSPLLTSLLYNLKPFSCKRKGKLWISINRTWFKFSTRPLLCHPNLILNFYCSTKFMLVISFIATSFDLNNPTAIKNFSVKLFDKFDFAESLWKENSIWISNLVMQEKFWS